MAIPCALKGCSSEGRWYPVVVAVHKSALDVPLEFVFNRRHCDEHKAKTLLGDILTDEWWERICEGLAGLGKLAPTREMTRLDWSLTTPVKFPERH